MFHKRHHKTRRKKSRSHQRGLEKFLNSRLIIVLGVLFILIGFYYSLGSGEGTGNFSNVIRGFLSSSGSSSSKDASGMGSPMVLFYFLPAGLALIASMRYVSNYSNYTYPTAVICAIYLIIVQTKILMLNFIDALWSYPNFFIAAIFLLFPPLLLLIHSLLHRKSTLLFLSIFYFYISIIAYSSFYGRFFEILFTIVLLFSLSVHWVAQKIEKPAINLVNFFFAMGFFGLFWLRKFVVNAKPEFLSLFLIFGFLFYLLFAAIVLWSSTDKEHPMPKWMQSLLTGSNLLFYLGTTGYVIFKYFAFGYLWFFAGLLLLLHLAVFEGLKRYKTEAWLFPHHLSAMLLASLVLPLMLHQNMALIFMAGLAIALMAYAKIFRDKFSFAGSVAATALMIIAALFYWIRSYLPALFSDIRLPEGNIIGHGILSGVVLILALSMLQWLVKDIEIPLSKKWWSRTQYHRLLRTILLFAIFMTLGWTGFAIVFGLTGTTSYTSVAWFISGTLFLSSLILFYSGERSTFKKPILYLATLFTLLYPLLVHWNMVIYRTKLIQSGDFRMTPIVLHYLALGLLLLTGTLAIGRIIRRNSKSPLLVHITQAATILFLFFLLCTEYDNLSVLFSTGGSATNSFVSANERLNANQYLPWSVILWIFVVAIFVWAVGTHHRFLRNFSIVLYLGVLVKIFAWDFPVMGQGARSAVFIILGIFLIGFAWLYPRLLKADKKAVVTREKELI